MIHKLNIFCFEKWWQAELDVPEFTLIPHSPDKVILPSLLLWVSEIVYDKTTKKIRKNGTNTSSGQIEMEVWMQGPLPTLNLERRAFARKHQQYLNEVKIKHTFDQLIDIKLK